MRQAGQETPAVEERRSRAQSWRRKRGASRATRRQAPGVASSGAVAPGAGGFAAQGPLGNVWRHFWSSRLGSGGGTRIQRRAAGRGAARPPTAHGSPRIQGAPAPRVSSARAQGPRRRARGPASASRSALAWSTGTGAAPGPLGAVRPSPAGAGTSECPARRSP